MIRYIEAVRVLQGDRIFQRYVRLGHCYFGVITFFGLIVLVRVPDRRWYDLCNIQTNLSPVAGYKSLTIKSSIVLSVATRRS